MSKTTIATCWLCKAEGVVTYPCYDRDVCLDCLDTYLPGKARKVIAAAEAYEAPRLTVYGKLEKER